MVKMQCTMLDFRPQVLPNVAIQMQISPVGLIHHIFSCAFHVNPLSRISPR
jgi:hypothetical protein